MFKNIWMWICFPIKVLFRAHCFNNSKKNPWGRWFLIPTLSGLKYNFTLSSTRLQVCVCVLIKDVRSLSWCIFMMLRTICMALFLIWWCHLRICDSYLCWSPQRFNADYVQIVSISLQVIKFVSNVSEKHMWLAHISKHSVSLWMCPWGHGEFSSWSSGFDGSILCVLGKKLY